MNGKRTARWFALLAWGSWGIVNAVAQSPWPKVEIRPPYAPDELLVQYTLRPDGGNFPIRTIADMLAIANLELVSERLSPPPRHSHWLHVRLKPGARFGDAYRVVRNFDFGSPLLSVTHVQTNELYFIWTPPSARRTFALSSRMQVGTGDGIAIGGVSVPGEFPRLALIRVRGASLAQFGIERPLSNPLLKLFEGTREIARNDDWGILPSWERALAAMHQVAPDDARESLIVTYLDPGAYTAQVSGADGGTGVALLEIHLVDDFLMMPPRS